MPSRLPSSLQALESEQTLICAYLVPAMQRITDALRNGYVYYTSGEVDIATAVRLIAKLQGRFACLSRNRKYAYRVRKAGGARYKLVAHWNRSADFMRFVLFTDRPSPGDGETWADARRKQSRVALYEYEALQMTKRGLSGPAWTWQIQRGVVDDYRRFARSCINSRRQEALERMIQLTVTWPGFAGIRQQRASLKAAVDHDWRVAMPSNVPPPPWPRLRYVERIKTR